MKFFLLASFVALTCARPDIFHGGAGKHITVADDDTITINNNHGQTVVFAFHVPSIGQNIVDITFTGAEIPTKHIQVYDDILAHSDVHQEYPWLFVEGLSHDDSFLKSSKMSFHTQGDLLVHIFRRYQGSVDEITYHKLLSLIERAVQSGLISGHIHQVLVGLEQSNWEGFGFNHGVVGHEVVPFTHQESYGHHELDYLHPESSFGYKGLLNAHQVYSPLYHNYGQYYPTQFWQQLAHGPIHSQYFNGQQYPAEHWSQYYQHQYPVEHLNKYYGQQYPVDQLYKSYEHHHYPQHYPLSHGIVGDFDYNGGVHGYQQHQLGHGQYVPQVAVY